MTDDSIDEANEKCTRVVHPSGKVVHNFAWSWQTCLYRLYDSRVKPAENTSHPHSSSSLTRHGSSQPFLHGLLLMISEMSLLPYYCAREYITLHFQVSRARARNVIFARRFYKAKIPHFFCFERKSPQYLSSTARSREWRFLPWTWQISRFVCQWSTTYDARVRLMRAMLSQLLVARWNALGRYGATMCTMHKQRVWQFESILLPDPPRSVGYLL